MDIAARSARRLEASNAAASAYAGGLLLDVVDSM
jgi:hypothetical protein